MFGSACITKLKTEDLCFHKVQLDYFSESSHNMEVDFEARELTKTKWSVFKLTHIFSFQLIATRYMNLA